MTGHYKTWTVDYGLDCGLWTGLWTMDWTVDWTMDWAFLYELSCSTTICFATWLEKDL